MNTIFGTAFCATWRCKNEVVSPLALHFLLVSPRVLSSFFDFGRKGKHLVFIFEGQWDLLRLRSGVGGTFVSSWQRWWGLRVLTAALVGPSCPHACAGGNFVSSRRLWWDLRVPTAALMGPSCPHGGVGATFVSSRQFWRGLHVLTAVLV